MQKNKAQHTLLKIGQKVKKAIYEYGLIEDGDKILIGLSGGKDSLALTEMLAHQRKITVPKFSIVAAHIELENVPYKSDIEYLSDFCHKHDVEFHHISTKFAPANDKKKDEKTPCFFCSWSRRKALFDTAKQLGCNKIALGHHQDDIVETMLLNLIFQSSISTMPPKLKMSKFDMTIIRPLCLISEQELITMQTICNYPKQIKTCPFEKNSKRNDIKEFLKQMETLNPNVRQSVWGAMQKIQNEYLPQKVNRPHQFD